MTHRKAEVLISIAILVVFVALWLGWRDCARSDGRYVRGPLWMECIRR